MDTARQSTRRDHGRGSWIIRLALGDSITEETGETQGPQDEDDLGVFEAMDIQNILYQMNYEIEFIPWGVRGSSYCIL